MPPDLAEFQLDAWLVLVDGDPPADLPATTSVEHWRAHAARLLWVRARDDWARRHPFQVDKLDKLREERDVRRAIDAAYFVERGSDE